MSDSKGWPADRSPSRLPLADDQPRRAIQYILYGMAAASVIGAAGVFLQGWTQPAIVAMALLEPVFLGLVATDLGIEDSGGWLPTLTGVVWGIPVLLAAVEPLALPPDFNPVVFVLLWPIMVSRLFAMALPFLGVVSVA